MKAIIFPAGVGRRLQAFTQGKPKCLVEIGGRTLLSRHVECLNRSRHLIVIQLMRV